MPESSDLEPAGGVEAAREIVACAERTLGAASARIELRRELRVARAEWSAPRGWRGRVLRLAVRAARLMTSAAWRLATRRSANRGLRFGQMLGEGIVEPARDRYMIDFGSFAELHADGKTFGGRSGRPLQALRPWPVPGQVGDVMWLLRLLPGTADASPEGTETTHGTACRRLAAHVDMQRASAASAEGLAPPQVGRFEELRALPVTVWIDGTHIRRIRFEHGPLARNLTTLDLWEFGVPAGGLDWSRLPAFRSPGSAGEPAPWYQRVLRRLRRLQ